MNGAELLIKTAVKAGIEVCFANVGTTELPLVMALESEPRIRPVMALFEGVCTGAADGYGRMRHKPAMNLLHLGPGLANGIANLHNAKKAKTPVLNVVGEHATWHLSSDPPLAMDIEPLAGTVSTWVKTNKSPKNLSKELADAVSNSMFGQISTLIVPHDNQIKELSNINLSAPSFSFEPMNQDSIEESASLMRTNKKTALILGGGALGRRGLYAAARIKAKSGCDLITGTFPAYIERGVGLPDLIRIPDFPEKAIQMLSQYEAVVLAGTNEPVSFFGYEGVPGKILSEKQVKVHLASDRQDIVEALEQLADVLKSPKIGKIPPDILAQHRLPAAPRGRLTPEKACMVLALSQPEGGIIVDEGLTTSFAYYPLGAGLAPFTHLTIVGGAIGYGMPCSAGAAIACPDRPVINLQADGSAMYTVQALWTEAREALNVTTLICSNRSYNILKVEFARAGITSIGRKSLSLIDLGNPNLDWVKIAQGMGVPAVSVDTAEALSLELRKAQSEPGPHLIEMILPASKE